MGLCNVQRTLGSPSPLFPVPSAEPSPVSLLDCWGLGVGEGEQMEDKAQAWLQAEVGTLGHPSPTYSAITGNEETSWGLLSRADCW